eukprot:gene6062-8346_t
MSTIADYLIYGMLSENSLGSYGVVMNARRRSDQKEFVMKFFGYTNSKPDLNWILREIDNLKNLKGINGLCQIEATFNDSKEGLISRFINKKFKNRYPIIVLEKLSGGELFDRILEHAKAANSFTELEAISIFGTFIRALREVHDVKNVINCDLKTENLVFQGVDCDSVKIIDFGQACSLWDRECLNVPLNVNNPEFLGTLCFTAPETILTALNTGEAEYSRASDIWQAGCILYTILVGALPFNQHLDKFPLLQSIVDNNFTRPIPSLRRSPEARHLLSRLFDPNPTTRITCTQILEHPWIVQSTPSVGVNKNLGESYFSGIRQLNARKRFRTFLLSNISILNSTQRSIGSLGSSGDEFEKVSSPHSEVSAASSEIAVETLLTRSDILLLKDKFLAKLGAIDGVEMAMNHPGIPFETFKDILSGIDHLSHLCSRRIFNIFDWDNNELVDYFEFLFTLSRFESDVDWSDYSSLAQVYFDIFSVEGSKELKKGLLKIALTRVMREVMAADAADGFDTNIYVDDIVHTIDANGDDTISFEEFHQFIKATLDRTMSHLNST